jgi:hypothetical protein
MKTTQKTILAYLVLLSGNALATSVMLDTGVYLNQPYDANAIQVIVNEFDGWFRYTYTFDRSEFIPTSNNTLQDLSNFSIVVCDAFTLSNIQTTNSFMFSDTEHGFGYFKFEGFNQDQPLSFSISFDSPNIPTFGNINYKYGNSTESIVTLVPSCQTIPEPNTSLIGLLGAFLLLNKRKR